MTDTNRENLIRLLLPLLAVLVGTLLTAITFLLAGSASASCNCSRPIAVAFPYASIFWNKGLQSFGGALMAFQFPVYALVVAFAKSRRMRLQTALILLAVHVVAVIVSLMIPR